MRKGRGGGRFSVEAIGRAIGNCQPVRVLTAKVKDYLTQMDTHRLQTICMVFIVGLLIGDVVLLFQAGDRTRAAPHYSAIRPVTTTRADRRPAAVKAFGEVWDSLMAEPATKKRWDSLLRLRPGLRDTIRQLERMDSAVWGR